MTAFRRPIAFFAVAGVLSLPWAAAIISAAPAPSVPANVGIDLAGIDRSVAPGADFFAYANGTWMKTTAIPPDRAGYGVGALVDERTNQRTDELIKQAASANAPAGSDTRKIGDYYASYMDEAGIEAKAYDAYRLSLNGAAPVVEGLTGDQQFFLSFAQSWRAKVREPALRQQILGDGHAPDEYRADTVRNLDVWYDAFDVKPSQALYLAPGDRVRVW
jgi:predicted metalloendopeptidase